MPANLSGGAWSIIALGGVAVAIGFKLLMAANGELMETNAELHREVAAIHTKFERMKVEHQLAIKAADDAMKARDEIHSFMDKRLAGANKKLAACPDFSNMPIPDDLRLYLKEQCERELPASGRAAIAY